MGELTYAGVLLRRKRLERSWSQEGLCKGICTVYYLSKIEQGKAAVSQEILGALFSRLDTPWYGGPQDLEQGRAWTEEAYEALLSRSARELEALLNTAPERLAFGPCAPDLQLLRWAAGGPKPEPGLEPCLDQRQLALYDLSRGRCEEALRHYPCGYTYWAAGIDAYSKGDNPRALELLQTGYQLAAAEGSPRVMLECKLYAGNCYSNLRRLPEMLAHYEVARRLASALGETEALEHMAYNIAATRLELGEYEQSYRYFASRKEPSRMDLHKLAICCEKLGKPQEALAALDRAREAPCASVPGDLGDMLCDLVRFRLEHPDYLQREEYGRHLTACFRRCRRELPAGYAVFHLPWMVEWYTARRQYREAFLLVRDFPGAVLPEGIEPGESGEIVSKQGAFV